MRTLIYKRTHPGDPGPEGEFGIHGCMGQVRTWGFEAVVGVGGMDAEPKSHGLAGKVNWIGIGPRRRAGAAKRAPIITFDHFLFFGSDGPSFLKLAPQLAPRIYSKNVRVLMDRLDRRERVEVERLLALAKDAPPSSADGTGPVTTPEGCVPRTPPAKSIKGCSS